ncbi:hypothetical protein MOJ76_20565 [Bacillus haynesii]|uniref:hypothetical protein n=1 Tax=Bacillus haynesii TaxID=1925021 RepID=UPI002282B191|nr:hypothetical protein [Bacillus haynesii]MCY8010646.1 hypothetical protein [Bacillus haynesii]
MLKLNEKAKFRRLPEDTRHHLIILVDRDEKKSMCILNIFMLDVLLLFLLLANGIKLFTLVALPPLIFVMSIFSLVAGCLFSFISTKFIHQFFFIHVNREMIKKG